MPHQLAPQPSWARYFSQNVYWQDNDRITGDMQCLMRYTTKIKVAQHTRALADRDTRHVHVGIIRSCWIKVNNIYIWSKNMYREVFSYKTYLIFLFASLAVSIGLQIILPFPIGLGVALGLFIVFPLLLRKRYMNRMRGDSGGGAGGFFGLGSRQNKADVHYVCLVCRNRYKGGSCPRCGSKMKRADF